MVDIGGRIPNIDGEEYRAGKFHFQVCGFHSISEVVALFVVFLDANGKSHYIYLNDETYDGTYGFNSIVNAVVDGQLVPVENVFGKVTGLKEMDSVSVVFTDYGFWDLETNDSNGISYSYRGGKSHQQISIGNDLKTKLVLPMD